VPFLPRTSPTPNDVTRFGPIDADPDPIAQALFDRAADRAVAAHALHPEVNPDLLVAPSLFAEMYLYRAEHGVMPEPARSEVTETFWAAMALGTEPLLPD
jgi:hypothetical protein